MIASKDGVLKEHSSVLLFVFKALDLAAITIAGWLAYRWTFGEWGLSYEYKLTILLALALSFVVFSRVMLYRNWRGNSTIIELRILSGGWISVIIIMVTLYALTKSFDVISEHWMVAWAIIGWAMLSIVRVGLRFCLRWIRSRGFNQRSIVLVGMNDRGLQIAGKIEKSAWTGFQIKGYFDERSLERVCGSNYCLDYLGHLSELAHYVEHHRIDQVWIVYPMSAEDRVKTVVHELRHSTVDTRYVLDIFSFNLCNHSISEVAGIPILNLSASPLMGTSAFIKEVEDRLLTFAILIVLSPIMLFIAIGVKLSSPGPIFYKQQRVSWNSKPFWMLKFRSMPVDAEQSSGPVWNKKNEQRATKFGAFLRKSSLDELPQFINVLKGDMSIVGPRPERPIFVDQFKEEIPQYMKKHMVKAGITGWAQVNGWRGDTDLVKRIEHDLYYIENWSVLFDLRILLLTLFKGFVHKNAG